MSFNKYLSLSEIKWKSKLLKVQLPTRRAPAFFWKFSPKVKLNWKVGARVDGVDNALIVKLTWPEVVMRVVGRWNLARPEGKKLTTIHHGRFRVRSTRFARFHQPTTQSVRLFLNQRFQFSLCVVCVFGSCAHACKIPFTRFYLTSIVRTWQS